MSSDPKVWLAAILTLASFSWVIKQNPAYAFCERAFIGLGAGYGVTVGIDNIISAGIIPVMKGNITRIIPLALGVLLLSSVVDAWHRNRALPNMIIIGIGTGLALRTVMQTQIIQQISATWIPPNSINNLILIVGTATSMAYFVFTVATKDESPAGQFRKYCNYVGAVVLMATFGASFGTAVQARISTFAARIQFLLGDWITMFNR
jgi:hypothetical protein